MIERLGLITSQVVFCARRLKPGKDLANGMPNPATCFPLYNAPLGLMLHTTIISSGPSTICQRYNFFPSIIIFNAYTDIKGPVSMYEIILL